MIRFVYEREARWGGGSPPQTGRESFVEYAVVSSAPPRPPATGNGDYIDHTAPQLAGRVHRDRLAGADRGTLEPSNAPDEDVEGDSHVPP